MAYLQRQQIANASLLRLSSRRAADRTQPASVRVAVPALCVCVMSTKCSLNVPRNMSRSMLTVRLILHHHGHRCWAVSRNELQQDDGFQHLKLLFVFVKSSARSLQL